MVPAASDLVQKIRLGKIVDHDDFKLQTLKPGTKRRYTFSHIGAMIVADNQNG